MPLMSEPVGLEGKAELIPREEYIDYLLENPGLTPMPREMRLDLPMISADTK